MEKNREVAETERKLLKNKYDSSRARIRRLHDETRAEVESMAKVLRGFATEEVHKPNLPAKSSFEQFNVPEDVEVDVESKEALVRMAHRNREKTKLTRLQKIFVPEDAAFDSVSAEELEDDAIYKKNGASRWDIEKVRRVFKQFDKDSSGTIDADDMHALLTHLLNGVELC